MSLLDWKFEWRKAGANEVRARLQENPDAAKQKDSTVYLLHLALMWKAPAETITVVLETHLAAAKEADKSGWYPLHHGLNSLCFAGSESAAAKEGNQDGDHVLWFHSKYPAETIAALLRAHPAAAKEANEGGWCPLHVGLKSAHPAETIAALLRAHPAAAREVNQDGDCPLQLARKYDHTAETIAAVVAAWPVAELFETLECKAPAAEVVAFVQKHPAAAKGVNKDGDCPLHCAWTNSASTETVQAVLSAHPAAAKVASTWDLKKMIECKAPPGLVKTALAARPDRDPAKASFKVIQCLSGKHGQQLDSATLVAAGALFFGSPPADPALAFRWMAAMLEHAPADRHVKAAILQMLGNSCILRRRSRNPQQPASRSSRPRRMTCSTAAPPSSMPTPSSTAWRATSVPRSSTMLRSTKGASLSSSSPGSSRRLRRRQVNASRLTCTS